MNGVRAAFLEAADASRVVLVASETAAHWDEPSALAEYSVRGLAGHLVRGTTTALDYVLAPEPAGEPIVAALYLASLPAAPALGAPQQVSIRQRGEEMSSAGREALIERLDSARAELGRLLPTQPDSRKVKVIGDQVMRLDDYLVTRIVELLVHTDDLAASVGLEPPSLPAAAADLALRYLLEVARCRTSDLAVLRAFSRQERDSLQALRIF